MEYQLDPRPAAREIGRVLQPGGSLYMLATEDTFQGAFNSRTWKCRTFNRTELRQACEECGLRGRSRSIPRLHKATAGRWNHLRGPEGGLDSASARWSRDRKISTARPNVGRNRENLPASGTLRRG